MSDAITSPAPDALPRVLNLQVLTIVWMTAEAIIALAAAWAARSPALLGFGGDSAIELFSAIVVLWRFRSKSDSARAEAPGTPYKVRQENLQRLNAAQGKLRQMRDEHPD